VQITNGAFIHLSATYIFGTIPLMFVFTLVLFFLYSVMLRKTRFGRSIFMAGGNPSAARLAGLNPKRIKSILFVNNGVLCAIAGLMFASQQQMAHPAALVNKMPHITSLIAALLGGVSFVGGTGSLFGAFFGIATIQLLDYALQTIGLPLWIISMVNGMLLVVAIAIDGHNMRKRFKALGMKMASGGSGMPGMSK
jgi:ribose transport system permease protein